MKKYKKILTAAFAVTMAFSAFGLTACGGNDPHKCGHVCETCGQCTTECTDDVCKDKCPGHELTEGVYNCAMGSYELLIKFYDEDTYYFQTEDKGFRGKYEIKTEQIMFSRSQPDGTDYNSNDTPDKAKWETSDQTIYFYQEDGVTPIDYVINTSEQSEHKDTIEKGVCYAYGTKTYVLAYNAKEDKIQSLKGSYGSRTLSHTKLRNFTINDEKDIVQAEYMVKTLPDDAEAGKVESDYFLRLSQKGYETNIPTLVALELTNGKFSKTNDTTYTLTDTISGATATLTVTASGATVAVGQTNVELVLWEDVKPYAVEVEGSAAGGKIKAKVRFNEDGTLVIFGSSKNYGGKYKVNRADNTITISDVDQDSPVTFTSVTYVEEDSVITVTANLSVATGMSNPATMAVEAKGTVSGKLYGLTGATLLEAESKEAVFGTTKMKLEMKDDCTLVLSVGGQSKVTAYFSAAMKDSKPTITFNKASTGTFAYTLGAKSTITWTGKLSDSQETDNTYSFEFENSAIAPLLTAKITEKYSADATVAKLGNQVVTLTFLADGTVTLTNPKMDIATGDWKLTMNGATPTLTFENMSSGTMTGAFASQTEYKVTWNGNIATGAGSVEVTIDYTFAVGDLANLM